MRRTKLGTHLLAAITLMAPLGAGAADIYVDSLFVGAEDGSQASPYNTIEEAIAAASSGDTIHVAAGDYVPTAPLTIAKPLTLKGAKAGVDPRSIAGLRTAGIGESRIVPGTGVSTIILISSSDVVIDGFEITGGTASSSTDHIETSTSGNYTGIKIQYNLMHANSTARGIALFDVSAPEVLYNYLYGYTTSSTTAALFVQNSHDTLIKGNELSNVASNDDGAISIKSSNNVVITENYINEIKGSIAKAGIEFGTGGNGGEISYNVIVGAGQAAIRVRTSNVVIKGNEITGTDTEYSERAGIYMTDGSNVTIIGNRVHDNPMVGDSDVAGIRFLYDPSDAFWSTVNGSVVKGNEIYGNTHNGLAIGLTGMTGTLDATYNWWGAADGPGTAGADTIFQQGGTVTSTPFLTTQDATVSINPATVNFGVLEPDTSTSATVTVENTSEYNLIVIENNPIFTISGDDAAQFSVVADVHLFPIIIPGGESRTFAVQYDAPSGYGQLNNAVATLNADEATTFSLVGATQPVGVADIAEARGNAGQNVHILSAVTVTSKTNGLNADANDNQFFVQDSSAGILVCDPNSVSAPVEIGDFMVGLEGVVSVDGTTGMTVLTLTAPVNVGTGTPLTPMVLDGTVTDFADIESELVRIVDATVADVGNWSANTTYSLTAPSGLVIDNIRIEDASEYVGQTIPTTVFDVIGIAVRNGSTYEIQPRIMGDIIPNAAVSEWTVLDQ